MKSSLAREDRALRAPSLQPVSARPWRMAAEFARIEWLLSYLARGLGNQTIRERERESHLNSSWIPYNSSTGVKCQLPRAPLSLSALKKPVSYLSHPLWSRYNLAGLYARIIRDLRRTTGLFVIRQWQCKFALKPARFYTHSL